MRRRRTRNAKKRGLSKPSRPGPLLVLSSLLAKTTHGAPPAVTAAPDQERDATPDWRTLYKELQRDWNALVARPEEPDLPLLLMDGYDALIPRVRALADHPDLSEHAHDMLEGLLEYHESETVARQTAENYLASAERHVEIYKALERHAQDRRLLVTQHGAWPKWCEAAEMLAATGEAILSSEEMYGPYLDAITIGKARARLTVEQLRNRLRAGRIESPTPEPKAQELKLRPESAPKQEHEGFAHILDDPEKLREASREGRKARPQAAADTSVGAGD